MKRRHDFHHHPLSHAPWGQHRVAADEVWLFSTGRPEGWDSRSVGPVRRADVRATARAVVTLDSNRTRPTRSSRGFASTIISDEPAGSWP